MGKDREDGERERERGGDEDGWGSSGSVSNPAVSLPPSSWHVSYRPVGTGSGLHYGDEVMTVIVVILVILVLEMTSGFLPRRYHFHRCLVLSYRDDDDVFMCSNPPLSFFQPTPFAFSFYFSFYLFILLFVLFLSWTRLV